MSFISTLWTVLDCWLRVSSASNRVLGRENCQVYAAWGSSRLIAIVVALVLVLACWSNAASYNGRDLLCNVLNAGRLVEGCRVTHACERLHASGPSIIPVHANCILGKGDTRPMGHESRYKAGMVA